MRQELILLGSAQDGGLPQVGCRCDRCQRAAQDPINQGLVTSLGILSPTKKSLWLIDASPDLRQQLGQIKNHTSDASLAGIFLTHAHVGHYTGLMFLGREAWNTQNLPVYCSFRMAEFLKKQSALV